MRPSWAASTRSTRAPRARAKRDANTLGAAAGSKIDVFEYGLAINYWYTRYIRASVDYILYHTPGAAPRRTSPPVPANVVGPEPSAEEHLLHELRHAHRDRVP